MLVNSVVVVLREVLEAALLISILLAVSQRMELHRKWLLVAFLAGVVGASAYAKYLAFISELFDGFGQEIINASLQLGTFAALLVCVFLIAQRRNKSVFASRSLSGAMAIAVALAVIQKGSETIVYISGFLQMKEFVSGVSIGSLTGLGIGVSIGVLFYYFLLALPEKRAFWVGLVLLGFAGSSMVIHATQLLIQADVVVSGSPVWDSSALISEGSLPGELLYAFVGYEATPSATELAAYLLSFAAIGLAAFVGLHTHASLAHEPE